MKYEHGKYENDGFPVMYLIARGAHGGAGLTVRAHLTLLLWGGGYSRSEWVRIWQSRPFQVEESSPHPHHRTSDT